MGNKEREDLLQTITEQWTTIWDFSYASAWMESHKQLAKKGTQKSKGVRKKLVD